MGEFEAFLEEVVSLLVPQLLRYQLPQAAEQVQFLIVHADCSVDHEIFSGSFYVPLHRHSAFVRGLHAAHGTIRVVARSRNITGAPCAGSLLNIWRSAM